MKVARLVSSLALLPTLVALSIPSAFAQYQYTTVQAAGSNFTIAIGQNDLGLITGLYADSFGFYHGYVRSQNGTITSASTPLGSFQTTLGGVNNAGIAAGSFLDFTGVNHSAFYDTTNDSWTPAPDIAGTAGSAAVSINNANLLLGYSFQGFTPGGTSFVGSRGYFYNGTSYSFFDAPNVDATADGTIPEDINDSGTVVGFFTPQGRGGLKSGFIRNAAGSFTVLNYPGADDTFIEGINNSGMVAGSYDIGTDSHSFLWSSHTGFVDFDLPFGTHTEIWGIDNFGNLVGDYAVNPDLSFGQGFIASVAPEPGTLAFCLLASLTVLPVMLRRSSQTKA